MKTFNQFLSEALGESNDGMLTTIEGIMGRKADKVHSDGRHVWNEKNQEYPVVYHSRGKDRGAFNDRILPRTVTYGGMHGGKYKHLSRPPSRFSPGHLKDSVEAFR